MENCVGKGEMRKRRRERWGAGRGDIEASIDLFYIAPHALQEY